MRESKRRGGFTLLEMLVIIGIIGLLMAVLLPSFGYIQQIARQSRAQTLVCDAATSLTTYVQYQRAWPDDILKSKGYFDRRVCGLLREEGLLDVTTYKDSNKYEKDEVDPNSPERFGLLDPWGQAYLKRNPKLASVDDLVGNPPRPLRDHLLQFRIDSDFNGKVDGEDTFGGAPLGQSVRASAIVWSRGPSGKDDTGSGKYPKENRLSWALEK